jgi:carbohydrate diacid regulator
MYHGTYETHSPARFNHLKPRVEELAAATPAALAAAMEELRATFRELRAYEEHLHTLHSMLPGMHQTLKERFIYDLLSGKLRDEEMILADAKTLGLDIGTPRSVILIAAGNFILGPQEEQHDDATIRQRAQQVIRSIVTFFHLPNDTICSYVGNGEVAILKASNTRNLAVWADQCQPNPSWANLAALKRACGALLDYLRPTTGAVIDIGIGRYHPGIQQLAHSCQDARAALSLGRRFHNRSGVHCLDDLGIAAFVGVADEQTKVDLATYLLGPLSGTAELIPTLEAYFAADCSMSITARELSIHRNTLTYRLDKIAALTGLDPRRFDDSVQIRLALVLRALRGSKT